MKKYFSFLFFVVTVLFFSPVVLAQNCKVLDPNLAGVYTGECKNGKAEGLGKAAGTNTYEGQFKLGLPDGTGIYSDAKGNSFKGSFKKGKRDGEGVAIIKTETGETNTVTGFWKKDVYIGLFESTYKLVTKTYMVNTVNITFEPASSIPTIELNLESVTGGSVDVHGDIPKPTLSEAIFVKGSYQNMSTISTQQKRNTYILQNLIYPATVIFKVGTEEVQINFNEQKNYKVTITLRG